MARQARIGRVNQRQKFLAVALEMEASSEEVHGFANRHERAFAIWIGFDAGVHPAVFGVHLYGYPCRQ
jgi:hypothetical protein